MFEKYKFEGVYIAIQAVLTLYAQGLLSNSFSLTTTEYYNYMTDFIMPRSINL